MLVFMDCKDVEDERSILMKVIKALSEENTKLKAEIVHLKDTMAGLYEDHEDDAPSISVPF